MLGIRFQAKYYGSKQNLAWCLVWKDNEFNIHWGILASTTEVERDSVSLYFTQQIVNSEIMDDC